jgi:transmembrane sensor
MSYSDKLNLIHKSLTGELSPNEKIDFLSWKEENKNNQILAEQIEKIWSTPLETPSLDFDEASAYQKHLSRIEKESLETSTTILQGESTSESTIREIAQSGSPRIFNLSWFRVLAAVIILVIAVLFIFDNKSTTTNDNVPSMMALNDGTKVWLEAGSALTPKDFLDNKREVALQGKGYFDISPNINAPFIITALGFDVEVLGTKFVVNTNTKEVSVREGKVKVSNSMGVAILLANQKLKVSDDGTFQIVEDVFESSDLWFNEELKFNNAPFDQVINDLSVNYNVKFILPAKTDWSNCKFTSGSLKGNTLDQILVILKLTYELEYTRLKDNNIKLSKVKCK